MTAVGAFYEDETIDFVQQDSAEAFRWYEKAAKKGEVDAMVRLGMMYDVGIEPVEKDMVKANKLFAVRLCLFGKQFLILCPADCSEPLP